MPPSKHQRSLWKVLDQTLWGGRRVLLTALSLTGFVVALRLAGLLQSSELAMFDQLLRLRPPEPQDQQIVLVGIDEADLRKVGKYPIPDRTLADLLIKIRAAQPRAIGLDLYRDLPVEPGYDALRQVYQTTPNLVGIEHIWDESSPEVPPPPLLNKENQVGFNNVVHDQDDKVRRGLLYSKPDKNRKARPSFALALALMQLQAEGITPKAAADGRGSLQLGKAVFRRFTSHDGSYAYADDGGYQILLNPRGPANSFRRVYMTEVLEGKVSPEVFRDRIVLIGYTAVSLNDFVFTAYSSQLMGAPQPVSGVELHANLISQILQAAINGRPLLQTWSDPLEVLWILVWAWLGAILSWKLRSPRMAFIALALAGASLLIIAYGLIVMGWWIPVVAPLLAMTGAATAIAAHILRLQEGLRRSKEFLNSIINTIPDPIYVKDINHRWIVLNEAYARFLGYPLEELVGRSDYDVFSQQEADGFRQQDELVFTRKRECQNEESFTDRSGNTHQVETKRSLHKDAAGNLFLVGVIRDITQRKRMEEELKHTAAELTRSNAELQRSAHELSHQASHDALTGLPNRKLFHERLDQALSWASEHDQLVGLLFLDLDGFKQINDSRGHDVGDLLLQAVARRLSGSLRGSDTVARLGGDEFTIILPAIPSSLDAARVAQKLLDTLAQEFMLGGQAIAITSSIGISMYPEHGQDLDTLVKEADNAMYRAKQLGKNRYEFAPSSLHLF